MNNTRTRTTLAIAAIFIAATLVVGVTFAATTHSAFAYFPKKDDKKDKERDGGNGNGNTVTIQANKQKASQSGWDNTQEQEAQNTICTHPGSNATCVSEGSETNSTDTSNGE
jgi:ABC-type antimicrobial peptide transport system permease subunit